MSVIIYFGMIGFILLAGFIVLGITFRHWYLESKQKSEKI